MKKNLSVLIVLFIVLVAAWWWLGTQEETRQRGDVPEQATQVDTLTLDRMVLQRHNQAQIVFERDADGIWWITEPVRDRAAEHFISQMKQGLSTLKYINKVSSRESQHASFMVDEVQAARLSAYAGEQLQADLFIGKTTPDQQHVYIRPAGDAAVYAGTGGGAVSAFRTRAVTDFRNRRIFDQDETLYDSLSVLGQQHTYGVARADTAVWRIRIGDGPYTDAASSKVDGLMRSLVYTTATGFADETDDISWDDPVLTARLWLIDGREQAVHFQPVPGEATYWLKVEGRSHVYKVFESAYKNLERDPKEFLSADAGAS